MEEVKTTEVVEETAKMVNKAVDSKASKTFLQKHENGAWMTLGAVTTLTVAGGVYLIGKYAVPVAKRAINSVAEGVIAKTRNDGTVTDAEATEVDDKETE